MEVSQIEMIQFILFVLCFSPAPIHTTNCYIRSVYSDRIPEASKPLPQQGKYSIDWGAAFRPQGARVCLEKVMIYYMCHKKEDSSFVRSGCEGSSEAKYPSRDKDVSPVILPICADDPEDYPEYFRNTMLYFEVFRSSKLKK